MGFGDVFSQITGIGETSRQKQKRIENESKLKLLEETAKEKDAEIRNQGDKLFTAGDKILNQAPATSATQRKNYNIDSNIGQMNVDRNMLTTLPNFGKNQYTSYQTEALDKLRNQANGSTPTFAEQEAKLQSDRALASQLSMASSMGNSPLAHRQLSQNMGNISQAIAGQTSINAGKERLDAMSRYGGYASELAKNQDSTTLSQQELAMRASQANADKYFNASKYNQDNQLKIADVNTARQFERDRHIDENQYKNQALNYQTGLSLTSGGLGAYNSNNQQMGVMDKQRQYDNDYQQQQQAARGAMMGAAASAASTAASIYTGGASKLVEEGVKKATESDKPQPSDINLKKNIEPDNDGILDFLRQLDAYEYDYKDKELGEGRQRSVMAQDLEKNPLGKDAVVETPIGKAIDYHKLLPEMFAGMTEMSKKIMTLEEALKRNKERT